VRELQNVLQRYLATHHLNIDIPLLNARSDDSISSHQISLNPHQTPLPEAVKEFEKTVIKEALARNNQHKINTAKMLGIPRSTLHRKIKEHNL